MTAPNPPLHVITTAMSTYREGDNPIFGETALTIRVDDEAGGWFFEIEQHDGQKIRCDLDELRALLSCAEQMAKQEPMGPRT
jgi:hypothetical protein